MVIPAPFPEDEEKRLKSLYEYAVLDTEAEEAFDGLVQLASRIADTPIALVSLIDKDRQWFKAKVGLTVEETSRDVAFCAHAIHGRGVFEVPDALLDARFHDNPLVVGEPKIRSYTGAPLITPEGLAIGTLCAIGNEPRRLTSQQIDSLEILARQVVSQLELRNKMRLLNEGSQLKTDYLSNISHEIRTPLNAIVNFSDLLLEETIKLALPRKLKEYVDHIEYSSRRLLDIVNAVLDLSKIEEGTIDLNPTETSVRDFCDYLRGMVSTSASQRNVAFEVEIDESVPDTIIVDNAKLNQMLVNVIHNALKFSAQGLKVTLHLRAEGQMLVSTVTDHGVGISAEELPHLFNRFRQVSNAKSNEGTGLGLAITKGLAELLGGSIQLISQTGIGTTVTIRLPLSVGTGRLRSKDNDDTAPKYRKDAKILVVEDQPVGQAVAKAVFTALGISITIADSGEKAVELTQTMSFDLILMDMNLPGMNGLEATARIKAASPNCSIVALTADVFAPQDSVREGKLDDFLSKPIDRLALIRLLNRYLPASG